MTTFAPDRRSRAAAAAAAVALQLIVGWVLVFGLSGRIATTLTRDIAVFDVAPPPAPPPKPPVPVHHAARKAAGAAAPPHARATPTPVVVPPPVVVLPPPPAPVIAAPVAATGSDSAAGAADAGQGTGAGGEGNGRGAGSGGDGTGAGGTPARFLRGRITDRDYPEAARRAGVDGSVTTRYLIDEHGRIARCYVAQSSGDQTLDATTCRLAIERFRFAPARDATGRPVEDTIYEEHRWVATRFTRTEPADPGPQP